MLKKIFQFFAISTLPIICVFLFIYFHPSPVKKWLIQDHALSVNITLKKNNDSSFVLSSSNELENKKNIISEWKLNYTVYHFECAEMNDDGVEDILVGVIKKTRFDSISRKRIFIFKLVDGYIRPLWLGSKVSCPLEDFKVIHLTPVNYIRTIEVEKNGNFLLAEYKWKGFGITFVRYIIRNTSHANACQLFNK
jgi:hypothetical protein